MEANQSTSSPWELPVYQSLCDLAVLLSILGAVIWG